MSGKMDQNALGESSRGTGPRGENGREQPGAAGREQPGTVGRDAGASRSGKAHMLASATPEVVTAFSRRRDEPDWLAAWRRRGYEIYRELPLPIRADHLWRYTDPELFEPTVDPFDGGGSSVNGGPSGNGAGAAEWPDDLAAGISGKDLGGVALVHDGTLGPTWLDPEVSAAGIVLTDLRTAARERPDELQRVFGAAVGLEFGKFEALNAATFRGGVFLRVPRGAAPSRPIHLRRFFDQAGLGASRLAVLVEDGASLTLIDELESGPTAGQAQIYGVVEIVAGAGSRVHFVSVQNLARTATLHLTQRARLGRGASFVPVIASFGAGLAKIDAGTVLEGEGSETEMIGFVSGIGRQRFDHHTVHLHQAPHTRSNLDFKTVLKDRSRSAYTGLIRIERESRFTEAYQENRNLLLSENCRAESIPELEILNEEVQCKHGATVGPLNPDHLFYLMSRAIPRAEAIRIIVEGHFEPALRRLPTGLRERLTQALRDRLKEL